MKTLNHVGQDLYRALPKTVYEAYITYISFLDEADVSKLNTALLRFVVPKWGGPEPTGARMTAKDQDTAIKFLRSVPLDKLWSATMVMESYMLHLGKKKTDQRTPRYNLNKFLHWATNQGWGASIKDADISAPNRIRISNPRGHRKPTPSEVRAAMGCKKAETPRTALRKEHITSDLEQQLAQWDTWMAENAMGGRTRENSRETILRILGWMHYYGSKPLDDLKLEIVIPFVKTKYELAEFEKEKDPVSAWILTKEKAIVNQKTVADAAVERLKQYLSFSQGCARSKMQYLIVVIRLAKYLYQYETEFPDGRDSYSDVIFIRQLRRYQAKLQRQAVSEGPTVPFSLKSIPLAEVPSVLEVLKKKADQERAFHGSKRKVTAQARSIQRLLMVLFFASCPPRRVGAIAGLIPGQSLVRGVIRDDGRFVPEAQLGPNDSAVWVMRLGVKLEDGKRASYKTLKKYGTVDIEIVDYKFKDGTSFYTYIDLWLAEYRALLEPQTNTFFVRDATKGPMTSEAMTAKFTSQMNSIVGFPISPKEFRKMFVTYVQGRSETTERDKEGAAAALGHSRRMFDEVYDQEEINRKIKTGVDLARRVWEELA